MINHRKILFRLLVVVGFAATGPAAPAHAQPPGAGAGGAPAAPTSPGAGTPPAQGPAPASANAAAPLPVEEVPPGEAGSVDEGAAKISTSVPGQPPVEANAEESTGAPLVFPSAGVVRQRRVKPLRTTIGLEPTAPDFGQEADLVSVANEGTASIKPKRWTFNMHGFLKAPLNIGIGPGPYVMTRTGDTSSYQLHSPPSHMVGLDASDWRSVGLTPSPAGALYFSAGNAVIVGTVVVSASTFYDVGYKKLDQMGAISQAYVTMKFNDAFGSRGGLALTAGAFSNRYGLAGPNQNSSGYYNTFLYGRTRVAGANVTADIDLTDHVEFVLEAGGGAKLEVVPWLSKPLVAPYLPDQGPTPQGSDFVGQIHPAIFVDDWLKAAGHFMVSYSPNDLSASTGGLSGVASSQMTVSGADVHLDTQKFGHAYLGYSHIDASRVLSLADGIEVLHASNGYGLVRNYLNPGWVAPALVNGIVSSVPAPGSAGDSGKIDTVMFQYIGRLASLLELPATGRDLSLAVFGMFNHVTAGALANGSQNKLKSGAELEFAAFRYLSAGLRFDRVMPNGGNADVAYSALSPRLIFRTAWVSREYILLSYTRYFMGSSYGSVVDSGATYQYDKNLVVLSAQVAF